MNIKADCNKIHVFFLLLIIFAGGLFIRWHGLSAYTYNVDGFYELAIASGNLFDAIKQNVFYFTHPPMGTIFANLIRHFVDSDLYLRLIPLIPGMALVIISYFVGREMSGKYQGIFLSLITSYSYITIMLSQDMRGYSLMMALTFLSFFFLLRFHGSGKNKFLGLYFLFCFLALFTMVHSIIFFLALACFGTIRIILLASLKPNLVLIKRLLIWCLPHLFIFSSTAWFFSFQNPRRFIGGLATWDPLQYPETFELFLERYESIINFLFFGNQLGEFGSLFFIFALTGSFILIAIKNRGIFLFCLLGIVIHLVFNFYKILPIVENRYAFILFPFYALILSYALGFMMKNIIRPIKTSYLKPSCLYLIILCSAVTFNFFIFKHDQYRFSSSDFPKENLFRQKVENFISANIGGNDIIIMDTYATFFFTYKIGMKNLTEYQNDITGFKYLERDFYFTYQRQKNFMHGLFMNTYNDLTRFYKRIIQVRDKNKIRKIWYFNPVREWPVGMSNMLAYHQNHSLNNYISDFHYFQGVPFIFSITPEKMEQFIKDNNL